MINNAVQETTIGISDLYISFLKRRLIIYFEKSDQTIFWKDIRDPGEWQRWSWGNSTSNEQHREWFWWKDHLANEE